MGVNHSSHGVGGVVKSVHKLEAEGHQKGDPEQDVGGHWN